jgi:hypothetical protein
MKGKKYFNNSLYKVTLVLSECESTAHCSFWSGEGTFFTECDESIPVPWSGQLSPWSEGPGRVHPKLAQAYFSFRSWSAHNLQAGMGEQESQVEEPVLTIRFSWSPWSLSSELFYPHCQQILQSEFICWSGKLWSLAQLRVTAIRQKDTSPPGKARTPFPEGM